MILQATNKYSLYKNKKNWFALLGPSDSKSVKTLVVAANWGMYTLWLLPTLKKKNKKTSLH